MKKRDDINRKGITLIALVITIIILLILAGISLATLNGENGLIIKTKEAKEKALIEQAKEELKMKIYSSQAEKQGNITLQELVYYLISDTENTYNFSLDGTTMGVTNIGDANFIYVKYKGYIFKIDDEFDIQYISKVQNEENDLDQIPGATYLYYKGNEYTENSGEWVNNQKVTESSIANLVKEDNYMVYSAGIAQYYNPVCTKTDTIDISEYDTINAEIEIVEENIQAGNRNLGIEILNEGGTSQNYKTFCYPNNGVPSPEVGKKVIMTMDISEIENLSNVYFGISNHGYTIKIYSIYLTKYKKQTLDLYNYGNECIEIGGEWINNTKIGEYASGTLTKNSDNMLFQVNATSWTNPLCGKTELLDVTEYDKLKADIEIISTVGNEWRNLNIGVNNSSGGLLKYERVCGPAFGYSDNIGVRKELTLDLTDITDTQTYVGLNANGYTFKIYRVWLEKIIE